MKVLSLFDGISCGRVALERAGIEVSKYHASEIDKNAIKVTMENYPDTIQLGDVTQIKGDDVGEIDLLIGGSPCQDLSQAMKNRTGLEGEKSKLFFEYVRLLDELKPKYFLLENVGGMKKEDKEIMSEILGVQPVRINSSSVSGQLRNRLYWTNIPQGNIEDTNITLQSLLETGYTNRDKARCLLESDSRPLRTPVKMFHRYYSTGFTTMIFESLEHYKACVKHYESNYKGMSAREISSMSVDNSIYNGIRILTQREMERLQTLPDGYTNILNRNRSAGVIGNGWTVDVIAHIFKGLK